MVLETNPAVLNDSPSAGTYTAPTGMTTAQAEALGDSADNAFNQMAFSIRKVHGYRRVPCPQGRVHDGTCARP